MSEDSIKLREQCEQSTITGLEQQIAAERAAREQAEEALREIEMECGNPDPSDGEGTSPKDVVASVGGLKQRAEQSEARLAEALQLIRLSGCPCQECKDFPSSTQPPPILAERDSLRAQVLKLESAPLCAGHAEAWYCQRPEGDCIWCRNESELAALKLKLEAAKTVLVDLSVKDENDAPIYGLEVAFKAREALAQLNGELTAAVRGSYLCPKCGVESRQRTGWGYEHIWKCPECGTEHEPWKPL